MVLHKQNKETSSFVLLLSLAVTLVFVEVERTMRKEVNSHDKESN